MCNDHEHHVGYSNDDHDFLCFKCAVIESLNGEEIEVEVTTYEQKECERCALLKSTSETRYLMKTDATGSVNPVHVNLDHVLAVMMKAYKNTDIEEVRRVLERGNPVSDGNFIYQYYLERDL
jgi:hypothetical protein